VRSELRSLLADLQAELEAGLDERDRTDEGEPPTGP
jgi:hypothetical protein